MADDVLGSINVVMQYEVNMSDRHNDELTEWTSGDTHTYWSMVSTIEADEVDIPTTRIPTVTSVKGGAIKTVELFALCLKKCGWS